MKVTRILIVEDEAITARDLADRLSALGYEVPPTARTAAEAVRATSLHDPDLVLMDIKLRGTVDGIEAAEQIRGFRDIPIVLPSAYADEHSVRRAREFGPFGYVLKPVRTRELHITIELALQHHRAERLLRESNRWLARTLQSIADAVIATDANGIVRFLNPSAELLTGVAEPRAKGQPLAHLSLWQNDDGAPLDPLSLLVDRTGSLACEGRTTYSHRPVEISCSLVPGNGDPIGFVVVFRDISERRRVAEEVKKRAQRDAVTGLPNGLATVQMIDHLVDGQKLGRRTFALLLIDLDDFRDVYRELGRSPADRILAEAAARLKAIVESQGFVGRLSGDTFAIALPEAGPGRARSTAEALIESLSRPIRLEESEFWPSATIGISLFPRDAADREQLMRCADNALLMGKAGRKGRYTFYVPDHYEEDEET